MKVDDGNLAHVLERRDVGERGHQLAGFGIGIAYQRLGADHLVVLIDLGLHVDGHRALCDGFRRAARAQQRPGARLFPGLPASRSCAGAHLLHLLELLVHLVGYASHIKTGLLPGIAQRHWHLLGIQPAGERKGVRHEGRFVHVGDDGHELVVAGTIDPFAPIGFGELVGHRHQQGIARFTPLGHIDQAYLVHVCLYQSDAAQRVGAIVAIERRT